jgi:HEAT repeat protein
MEQNKVVELLRDIAFALASIGAAAFEPLLELSRDSSAIVRAASAVVLADFGDPRAERRLTELLEDENIRELAEKKLKKIRQARAAKEGKIPTEMNLMNLQPGSVVPKTGKYECFVCGTEGLLELAASLRGTSLPNGRASCSSRPEPSSRNAPTAAQQLVGTSLRKASPERSTIDLDEESY